MLDPHRSARGPAVALAIVLASSALVGGANAASRALDPFAEGRAGAEAAAVLLADTSAPVALDDHGTRCPLSRLIVEWEPPGAGRYQHGAYLEPLRAPDSDDRAANGIVVCRDSSFGYVGFEAIRFPSGEWKAYAVPTTADGTGDGPTQGSPVVTLPAGLASVQQGSPWFARWGRDIEPLATYEPQSTCDPSPKVGVAAFRTLVRQKYSDSNDLGIGRECSATGISEHKEGRAWDWGVRVDVPAQATEANVLISWLLATDEHGNRYAMARRLGLMYIIWDGHIWGSYRPDEGWRPYAGENPHTDHVHLSFDRAGALGRTSFWSVVPLSGVGEFASVFSSGGFGLGPVPPPHELGPQADATPAASSSTSGSDEWTAPAPWAPASSSTSTAASPSDPRPPVPYSGSSQPGGTDPVASEPPDPIPDLPTTTTPIDYLLSLLVPTTTVVDDTLPPLTLPLPP